jgi:Protein of unknown function, DUF488
LGVAPPVLWTVGYGAWPPATRAKSLVASLARAGVTRLIDTRHSPCASDSDPHRPYGPRAWHLQAGDAGIVALLASAGIGYEWIVELGNPQKRDPEMRILRAHLADRTGDWPVHRGLERVAEIVRRPGETAALLCACADARSCHRTVIAKALSEMWVGGDLEIRDVSRK